MNVQELLDVIGEAREAYVLDALQTDCGIKKRLSRRRLLLVAAAAVLTLLLVGCVAYVLRLQDLKITQEDAVSYYGEDGKRTAPTEVTVDVISLRGFAGSPNQKATLEWYEYEKSHPLSAEGNVNGIPDNYYYVYNCQTWEMVDKVDEICEKYSLKPLSMDTVVQRWQRDVFFEALQISGICKSGAAAEESAGAGYFYPEGNFKYEFELKLTDADAWPYEIWATMFCSKMDYFDPDVLFLDIDAYDQWNYTTRDGTQVLIAVKDHNGILFAQSADSYITLMVDTTTMLSAANGNRAEKRDFERIAEVINFAIQPKTENMVAAIPAMKAADDAYWAEKETPIRYNTEYAGYGDYMLNNLGRASIKGWCAIVDINADGVEELLMGETPDSFSGAATMIDGVIRDYLSVDRAYPCADSVIETFHVDANMEYHTFQKIRPGVLYVTSSEEYPELLEYVAHDTQSDLWYTGRDWNSRNQITKEEAQAILGKYKRLELHMTPIAEYPMDESGTTLRETAWQNTARLTQEERMNIYREIILRDQEKSYIPSSYYCLRDINGDGWEELLLGETPDYFGDAYTIFNGKKATIHFWSHMNLCENRVLEISSTTPDGESHNYYQLDPDGMIWLESVYYGYSPQTWTRSTEAVSNAPITLEEYQQILAAYPRLELDMQPIADFPS